MNQIKILELKTKVMEIKTQWIGPTEEWRGKEKGLVHLEKEMVEVIQSEREWRLEKKLQRHLSEWKVI